MAVIQLRGILLPILLLCFLTSMAQRPQKILGIAKEDKPLSYYQEQSTLWQQWIDADPTDADAWQNYYKAERSALQLRQPEAFAVVYHRHFLPLCKYLTWLTQNREQAKDLAQITLLKIFQEPQLFDPARPFNVWLLVVAKNRWKNDLREGSIRNRHLTTFAGLLPAQISPTDQEAKDTKLKAIERAMSQLSPSHREVVVLKYSNNLTLNEISQVLDCRLGTVKSRLFYA